MNVTDRPSVDWLSASSDLDEKLVTVRPGRPAPEGTVSDPAGASHGVSWSRKIFAVTPKLPSTRALLNTCG